MCAQREGHRHLINVPIKKACVCVRACLFMCVVLGVRQCPYDPGHAHVTCEGVGYSHFALFANLL